MAQIEILFLADHTADVMNDWLKWHQSAPVCLAILTRKEGSRAHTPAVLVTICENGLTPS